MIYMVKNVSRGNRFNLFVYVALLWVLFSSLKVMAEENVISNPSPNTGRSCLRFPLYQCSWERHDFIRFPRHYIVSNRGEKYIKLGKL